MGHVVCGSNLAFPLQQEDSHESVCEQMAVAVCQ